MTYSNSILSEKEKVRTRTFSFKVSVSDKLLYNTRSCTSEGTTNLKFLTRNPSKY